MKTVKRERERECEREIEKEKRQKYENFEEDSESIISIHHTKR